jgi:hypothetical protein
MRHADLPALFAIALALMAPACASPLAEGERSFADGHYAEAKTQLVPLEDASASWNSDRRAEYALYRGLTANALGDRDSALKWLNAAKIIEDAHPGSLDHLNRVRLKVGLAAALTIP